MSATPEIEHGLAKRESELYISLPDPPTGETGENPGRQALLGLVDENLYADLTDADVSRASEHATTGQIILINILTERGVYTGKSKNLKGLAVAVGQFKDPSIININELESHLHDSAEEEGPATTHDRQVLQWLGWACVAYYRDYTEDGRVVGDKVEELFDQTEAADEHPLLEQLQVVGRRRRTPEDTQTQLAVADRLFRLLWRQAASSPAA